MALAFRTTSFALATVAASGTSVNPSVAVPDNCHTILISNPSATVVGLIGAGVTAPAALTVGVNAQRIPPGATLSLIIGSMSAGVRGPLDNATSAGTGLVFDSIGGAVALEITYLNHLGVRGGD